MFLFLMTFRVSHLDILIQIFRQETKLNHKYCNICFIKEYSFKILLCFIQKRTMFLYKICIYILKITNLSFIPLFVSCEINFSDFILKLLLHLNCFHKLSIWIIFLKFLNIIITAVESHTFSVALPHSRFTFHSEDELQENNILLADKKFPWFKWVFYTTVIIKLYFTWT